jgi:osmoprotectant transport system permease protein
MLHLLPLLFPLVVWSNTQITVGSKAFTEGYVLGELVSQTLESVPNVRVIRKLGLGNTGIVVQALRSGEIDLYVEYTGTIAEAILKNPSLKSHKQIEDALRTEHLVISKSLGFSNNYALAVPRELAEKYELQTISDLGRVIPQIKSVFSHEFVTRADGLIGLSKHYDLPLQSLGDPVSHALGYTAIASGHAQLIDAYTTDARIQSLGLVVLEDDRAYFPKYEAVLLAQKHFVLENPTLWKALTSLEGTLTETILQKLNGKVTNDHEPAASVVRSYLGKAATDGKPRSLLIAKIWRRTLEHLFLVGAALFFAVFVGVPVGVVAARHQRIANWTIGATSVIQTIPALALLCFLVPVFGIGTYPAVVALCLYGLLPVLVATVIGISEVNPQLVEGARALSLSPLRILLSIELPIAANTILGGIRSTAVISIGTATLAALVGAGGYGVPIVSGLAINDTKVILSGAIPAALMAMGTHYLLNIFAKRYDWKERV